jgi:hypothetical protein
MIHRGNSFVIRMTPSTSVTERSEPSHLLYSGIRRSVKRPDALVFEVSHIGAREYDLLTVAPERQGERTDKDSTSRHDGEKCIPRDDSRQRAILRAPDFVKELHAKDLLT